jgi:hypothetical protein
MKPAGGAVGRCYAATRNRRAVLVVAPGPRLDAQLLDVAQIVPAQLPRRVAGSDSGVRALYAEVLREALRGAGVVRSIAPIHPRRQALAVAWLVGTLDDQVVLPVTVVCDALGIDAGTLAATVRRRVAP